MVVRKFADTIKQWADPLLSSSLNSIQAEAAIGADAYILDNLDFGYDQHSLRDFA
jgi:hypothetical protein